MSLLLLAVALPSGDAAGQTAKELVGSWTLVSATLEQGKKKIESFGPNSIGSLMLDGNGRFSIVVIRAGLPKFASNDGMAGPRKKTKRPCRGATRISVRTRSVRRTV